MSDIMYNFFRWSQKHSIGFIMSLFESKYPDRHIIDAYRISQKGHYFVKIVSEEIEERIYRQSVAYTTNEGTETGVTYRAVIYTKFPSKKQEARLKNYLDKRIDNEEVWTYQGFEMEEVGSNDIKGIELNKLYFIVEK